MPLKIYGELPSDGNLQIKVNNEIKKLYSVDEAITFDVGDKDKIEIDIEQVQAKRNMTPLFILLFFLTSIIQGMI